MSRFVVLQVVLLLTIAMTCNAVSPIAIESYVASHDEVSNKIVYGQIIVLRNFDVELVDEIHQIPIFSIQYEGLHHVKKENPEQNAFEARAKCVAERLDLAFSLMADGGTLDIQDDDWNDWRLEAQSEPVKVPAIYINHPSLNGGQLRIISIYDEDAIQFPNIRDSEMLAHYIKAVIEAHYLLFFKKSRDIKSYERLLIDQTREGKIFKEVFIRAQEVMELRDELNDKEYLDEDVLRDAVARISMQQRQRLVNMAHLAPRDFAGL